MIVCVCGCSHACNYLLIKIIKINDTTYTQNANHKTVLFTTHIFSIPYVPLLIKSVYF